MPHDFLGTFNASQFNRLVAFARDRTRLIDQRIRHLTIERQRIGFLQFNYDTAGKPTHYTTGGDGETTYIGNLMAAYEVLGGDPFYDLQARTSSQPIFRPKGNELATTQVLSHGEPLPSAGLSDGPSGNAVRTIRSWIHEDLDRLERLERKIRRMVDYSDQLQEEMDSLGVMRASLEVDGSLENLVSLVQQLLTDPTYRAIADDQGKDEFGKFIYAPMSSYEPDGRTPGSGVSIERTNQGYVVVGEGNKTS